MILTTFALAIGLWLLLVSNSFTLSTRSTALSVGAIAVTIVTLVVALVLMAQKRPPGVPLAERALVLTFLATIHLALLLHLADVPFLEVLLFGTGSLLLWIFYLGIGTRIRGKAYRLDFSRRMAATYPIAKRNLPDFVRWFYTLLVLAYTWLLASLLWSVVTSTA
jgi:hypothetical protein